MGYDDLDRLISVGAGGAQGGNAVFSYDGLDNIRVLDQGSRQFRHQYNGTNRLGEVRDPLGATLFTLTYDIRGNQTKRTAGGLSDTFTFDKANRLVATSIREAGVPVASTYLYDGLGRRVRETRLQATYSGYNQAGQLLHQRDLKPAVDTDHTYVYLAGSLVAERTTPVAGGATTVEYQHTDALGSPVATTDAVGAIVARNRQTAYGEPADGTWESGPGYTGHVVDAGARLVYMQQRYYDPVIGRFLSVDPAPVVSRNAPTFNRYSYAANNPYTYVDPDGRAFTLGGDKANVDDLVKKFSENSGDVISVDDKGNLSSSGNSQNPLAIAIRTAINSENPVEMTVVRAAPDVHVNDFDTKRIDVADIEGAAGADPRLDDALLTHAIVEYTAAANGADYTEAHAAADAAEIQYFPGTDNKTGTLGNTQGSIIYRSGQEVKYLFPFSADENGTPVPIRTP